MNQVEIIQGALSEFSQCFEDGTSIAVPTQYLYPSNGEVVVYIEGGRGGEFHVSDQGRSLDELSSFGVTVGSFARLFNPICRDKGVLSRKGIIFVSQVPIEGLATAIVMVAGASSEVTRQGLATLKTVQRRDLNQMIMSALERNYAFDRINRDDMVVGASSRKYKFDFSVQTDGVRLLVDSVVSEPASINAKAIANFDVAQNNDQTLKQRIVYDDTEKWAASDLSLLQMAAQTVPFSRFKDSLDHIRLTGHE